MTDTNDTTTANPVAATDGASSSMGAPMDNSVSGNVAGVAPQATPAATTWTAPAQDAAPVAPGGAPAMPSMGGMTAGPTTSTAEELPGAPTSVDAAPAETPSTDSTNQ